MEKQIKDLFQDVKTVRKIMLGFCEFEKFSDANISTMDGYWPAHAHFLSTRSNVIRDEILQSEDNKIRKETDYLSNALLKFYFISCADFYKLYGYIEYRFLRWLYTDVVALDNENVALNLLTVSHIYQLPTLFNLCEKSVLLTATITSCARLHDIAAKVGATTLLNLCKQWISTYWYSLQSPDCFKMIVDSESDSSPCEMMVSIFTILIRQINVNH